MRKQLFTLLTTLLATGAWAQEAWTYADCLEYAREHNISLRKSRISEQTAGYALEEAKAQWQPSLDFGTTQGYTNSPWSDGNKNAYNSTYGLNAGWTIWNGGKRENSIKQSKLRTEIEKLNTGDILRSIETDLLQTYLNILYAKESIGIYEEAARVSGAQADRAKQLMEAGKLSRVDYAQLAAQHEQDRYSLVNAQCTYDTRRMELKKLLQLGLDKELTLADVAWSDETFTAPLPSIEETFTLAKETDLRLKGLDLEKSSSALDVEIAKAGRRPNIALNAGVGTGYYAPGGSFGEGLKQAWNENIGVTLSLPIFDNKKTSTAVSNAKAAELDAQLEIENRETELSQTVENWYIDTRSARSRYEAAKSQVESASLSDELTNERFNLGYVNTVELMTSHNALIEARHSLLQAKYMAALGIKMIDFYRTATVAIP